MDVPPVHFLAVDSCFLSSDLRAARHYAAGRLADLNGRIANPVEVDCYIVKCVNAGSCSWGDVDTHAGREGLS